MRGRSRDLPKPLQDNAPGPHPQMEDTVQQRHVDRMPQFCQQILVRGLKIHAVHRARGDRIAAPDEQTDGGQILQFEDDSFPELRIDPGLVAKAHPRPGMYYVIPREGPVEIMAAEIFLADYVPFVLVQGDELGTPGPPTLVPMTEAGAVVTDIAAGDDPEEREPPLQDYADTSPPDNPVLQQREDEGTAPAVGAGT